MATRATWPGVVLAALLSVAGCDGDDESATPSETSPVTSTVVAPTTVARTTTIPPTTSGASPTVAPTTTTPIDCGLGTQGTQTISVGAATRSYDLYVPPDLGAGGARAPAMVLFHGFTSNAGEIAAMTSLGTLAPQLGVVLAVPQASGEPTDWHITDPSFGDTEFTDAVLEQLAGSPCVDGTNIWMAGFSAGSAWTAVYGCSHAERLAGLVLVSGLAPPICPENGSPMVHITHGTADPFVPFDGGDQPVGGSTVHLEPVPDSAAGWAARSGCSAEPATREIGETTTATIWTDCAAGTSVRLHAVAGLGHVWPTGAFNPGCVALRTMLGATDPYEPCAHP